MSCLCQKDRDIIKEAVELLARYYQEFPDECECNTDLLKVIEAGSVGIHFPDKSVRILIIKK